MYTREEASRIRQEFWTTFGKYLAPIPSAEGMRVQWLNYKTGFKDLYFRMDANNNAANIAIEMTHKDIEIQQMFYEQFEILKPILHDYLGEKWEWELHSADLFGKTISRIFCEKDELNIFDQKYWPELISFFKPRIIALDAFWTDAKYQFDALR